MTPSLFHAPPRPVWASQSVCTGPPDKSSLFNLPSAKNPSDLPSGDQNGKLAPSVLGIAFACGSPGS